VVINELKTIGSLAPLTPYVTGLSNLGSGVADASQFATALDLVRSYTNIVDGAVPGPALASGFYASSAEIITLANILASCINSDGTTICQQLFTLVTPPQGTAPTDTITAALDILKFPSNNTAAIFALMSANSPFLPALTVAPALWTLPILHITVTPAISPAACTYAIAPQITISDSTPGSVIFYTLDGSVPTTTSSLYMSPFNLPGTLSTSQTVRAIAVAANFAGSASVSAKYIIPAAGTITNLVFVQQPQTTVIGTVLPNIRIQFVDSYGNLVRNGSAGVYLVAEQPHRCHAGQLNGCLCRLEWRCRLQLNHRGQARRWLHTARHLVRRRYCREHAV